MALTAIGFRTALLGFAGAFSIAHVAMAAEGAVFGGPTGGTDIRVALAPPQSGFYGNLVGLYVYANGANGANGQNTGVGVNTNLGVIAGGLLYVYPFKPLGGTLDSFVQQAYSYGYAQIGAREGTASGANDIFVEFAGWSRHIGALSPLAHENHIPYGLTIKLAYSMILPTGAYNEADILPQGHNDFFYIPNASLTYITQPNAIGQGNEFDAHVFADIAGTNPTTDYFTGSVIDTDFAVSNRYKHFQFGVAGFYATEIQDDKQYGETVSPDGKRLKLLDLGPVFAYDLPNNRGTFKIKYQVPIISQNSLNVQRLVLNYSFKF